MLFCLHIFRVPVFEQSVFQSLALADAQEVVDAFSRDPTSYNRIRVALLASMPGTSFQDDVRAISLLEPYSKAGPGYDRLRQFGAILHAQLVERGKARARAEQLEKQLDALRAVERTIIERGQPETPAKR